MLTVSIIGVDAVLWLFIVLWVLLHIRFSAVSVVLTFNVLHSAHAPSTVITLSACHCCLFWILVCCQIAASHRSIPVLSMLCWTLMPRSVHTLLHHWSRWLLVINVCVGSCLLPNCCCTPLNSSAVSVALTFNTSPNARAPSSLIPLAACYQCLCWFLFVAKLPLYTSQVQFRQRCVDFQCFAQCTCSFNSDPVTCFNYLHMWPFLELFCCRTQHRLSVSSVVLTFNASLNARAPPSLIEFSACHCCLCQLLLVVKLLLRTPQVQWRQCCVGLQCLAQCTCSSITDPVCCLLMLFVLVLVWCCHAVAHLPYSMLSVLCWSSMPRPVPVLLQHWYGSLF